VTFEEYHFYALRTREEQRHLEPPKWQVRTLFSKNKTAHLGAADTNGQKHHSEPRVGAVITEEEWSNASRAFRTAGWGAIFYLVNSFSKRTSGV
jgi:hypothetical protein